MPGWFAECGICNAKLYELADCGLCEFFCNESTICLNCEVYVYRAGVYSSSSIVDQMEEGYYSCRECAAMLLEIGFRLERE